MRRHKLFFLSCNVPYWNINNVVINFRWGKNTGNVVFEKVDISHGAKKETFLSIPNYNSDIAQSKEKH